MHRRRRGRGREGVLRRHGRSSVESAACLELFYDVLRDLGDEFRRYVVCCLGARSVEGVCYSLVDGLLLRGWGVPILFRHH